MAYVPELRSRRWDGRQWGRRPETAIATFGGQVRPCLCAPALQGLWRAGRARQQEHALRRRHHVPRAQEVVRQAVDQSAMLQLLDERQCVFVRNITKHS